MKNPGLPKILSFLLVSSICITLVACASESKPDKKTETEQVTAVSDPAVSTHERIENGLPELDFGGREVVFITNSYAYGDERVDEQNSDMSWAAHEITAEELTSDPVNDAIYNRNLKISDELNVEIKEVFSDADGMNSKVQRDISSGDGRFDVICGSVCYQTPLFYEGYCYNLLDNGIEDYIDIEKPWWSQKWIEQAMLGDKIYSLTGSLSISLKRLIFVTFFNKTMAEAVGAENLYQVVRDGRWTIDYLTELSNKVYVDVNGNSKRDEEDTYGLLINHYECADVFWSCFDMTLLERTDDNWFVLGNDEEKIASAFDIVYSLIYENPGSFDFEDSFGFTMAKKMFAAGQALFASMQLKFAESTDFRNMTDEYGILPEPKYDEKQKEYYTYAQDTYSIVMIPVSAKDKLCSAAVLEAMACESYNSVEVAFLDNALKGRYSNDLDTRQMIDIIIDGFKVDPGFIYEMIIGCPNAKVFHGPIYNKERSFATAYAKMSRTIGLFLDDLREKVESFDY